MGSVRKTAKRKKRAQAKQKLSRIIRNANKCKGSVIRTEGEETKIVGKSEVENEVPVSGEKTVEEQ